MREIAASAVVICVAVFVLRGEVTAQAPAVNSFQFAGTDGPIYSLAWAPDGQRLASVGFQQVHLWRAGVEAALATFTADAGFVRAVAWSPDGKTVASAGQDGTVRIWSTETHQQLAVFDTTPSRAVEWSPDGSHVAVGGETGHFQIWRVADARRVQSAWLGATISSVSWSPDGRRVAAGGINGKASLWDVSTGRLVIILRAVGLSRNDVNGIAWSPQGRLLATAQGARGVGDIRLWDPDNGKLVQTLTGGGAGWLRAIAWSRDGQWIAAGGEEGNIRIWNPQTGTVEATRQIAKQPVWSLAWAPDGRSLAIGTGSFDLRSPAGTLALWTTPVPILAGAAASAHAREVETALVERGRSVAIPEPHPAPAASTFKDGWAQGIVLGPDPPFGNLETSFVEADITALGIKTGAAFQVRCRENTFRVVFGTSWAAVATGEWAAFLSLDRTLVVARNNASATAASGCAAGDQVFISYRP